MPLLQLLFTSVLTLVAIVAVQMWASRTTPQLQGSRKRATPAKGLQYLCVIACAGFLVLSVAVAADGNLLLGIFGAVLAAFGAIIMTPGLGRAHDVIWDNRTVSGPQGHWFPHLPIRRIDMPLSDVANSGEFSSGYCFIEDVAGRRIIYGYWYRGSPELAADINSRICD